MFVRACGKFAIRKRLDQFILRKKSNTQNLSLAVFAIFRRGRKFRLKIVDALAILLDVSTVDCSFFSGC